jgi:hypothetical protein
LVLEDGVHQPAGGFGWGELVGGGLGGEVDEPVDAERGALW